jgi:hypothetical protein
MLAFTVANINGVDQPANCYCYNPNAGGAHGDTTVYPGGCTTPGCSLSNGATVDCSNNSFNIDDGDGYGGLNIAGCNCPGDSYTGSVVYYHSVGNGYNGVYYDGNGNHGFNYTNCSDFGSLAYGLGAPLNLASNATSCCDFCCNPGGD